MKFRWKVTLCMVCLVSLLFGAGSCALIVLSFQSALEREQAAAKTSYTMLLHTLQVVGEVEDWSGPLDVSPVIRQLSDQGLATWSALSLRAEEPLLIVQESIVEGMLELDHMVDDSHCVLAPFSQDGRHYLQLSGQLTVEGTNLILSVAYDISPIYETRHQQQIFYGNIFFVLLTVCAVLAYSAARVLTRPLDQLSKAAQGLAAGDLACRANIASKDEIGDLAREFDAMAERQEEHVAELTATMEAQDRFIGSFTHELKTPMTSILGYADLLRRGTLTDEEQSAAANYIFSEGKRLERLSLKLLDLFLAEHQSVTLVPASPADLLEDLAAHLRPGLEQQNIRLTAAGEPGFCFLEPDLFRSLLLNLIDNSRKALDGGGSISVACVMTPNGCRVTVQDTGRGIPPKP